MLKLLERLRPTGDDAGALADAIARAEGALSVAAERAAELRAGRGAVLLAGGATATKHEAALAEAAADADRLGALLTELRTRHATAAAGERRTALTRMAADATAACEAAGRAIGAEYSGLAKRIAELLEAERAALRQRDAAMLAGAFDGDGQPPAPRAFYGKAGLIDGTLADGVRLPVHDDPGLGVMGGKLLWPPS